MRIGVDASCWSNRRGFGRYTRELVTSLVERHPEHEFVLVADADTAEAMETASSTLACDGVPRGARLVVADTDEQPTRAASADGSRSIADMARMGRAAASIRPSLFFFPAVYSYFPLPLPAPCVVTFHDAIAELHPRLVFPSLRARLLWGAKTWLAATQASRILTVSESARRQIEQAFGCPREQIAVVPEGPSRCFSAGGASYGAVAARLRLPAEAPVVLYVGGISPHKRLDLLLSEMARIASRDWHLALVGDLAGDSFLGCHADLLAQARSLGLERRVTFTGFVPDADLAALYNGARMLVLPSASEGFGLPVVEAMACGCPVVTSAHGSLPEVAGDAGVAADTDREGALAAAVAALLDDAGRREALRQAGLRRAASFSWDAAADRVAALFVEVAGGR